MDNNIFSIKNHYLYIDNYQGRFERSPNFMSGMIPEYLVIHYTEGSTSKGSISWLTSKNSNVSAHIVIDRNDGYPTQLVPFNMRAYHAGTSSWKGRTSLNRYSIGIELDNAGEMFKDENGNWLSKFRKIYSDFDVFTGKHKNQNKESSWHRYTPEQLYSCALIAKLLVETYNIKEIVGHDDISPDRKTDPGPAFPMDLINNMVYGNVPITKEAFGNVTPTFETSVMIVNCNMLNIRKGPGANFDTVYGGPLRRNEVVKIIDRSENKKWVKVTTRDGTFIDRSENKKWVKVTTRDGALEGWVNESYLRF